VIVASVSCIYGLGSPEEYATGVYLETGEEHDRDEVLRKLIDIAVRPQRHDARPRALPREGRHPRGAARELRDRVPRLVLRRRGRADHALRPAHRRGASRSSTPRRLARRPQYVTSQPTIERAVSEIRAELEAQVKKFEADKDARGAPHPPAHRVRPRDDAGARLLQRDRELLADPRGPSRRGRTPFTLLDYFPDDFVVFVDESHQTVPQIGGMYEGDRSRKQTLVDYGFRLPSALDNRPLRFDEFLEKVPQLVFVSATPGAWELRSRRASSSS
jgi:excinuclease ABC subunit B